MMHSSSSHPHPYGCINKFVLLQPGDTKRVTLVRIGGKQIIRGGNSIVDNAVDYAQSTVVMQAVRQGNYGFSEERNARSETS